MSNVTSVAQRSAKSHSSFPSTHHETFHIPNHSITHPNSRLSGNVPALNGGPPNSFPGSRLSLKNASHVTAKNVLFYRSGDNNYQSFKVAVTRRNFRTFDALLENLSEKVPLPFGVRTISTPNGTHGISRLEELEDGKSYICSDKKTVKPLNLRKVQKSRPPWFISKPKTRSRQVPSLARRSDPGMEDTGVPTRFLQVKTPKKVVIVKNGDPSFRHSILLSRRTPQSFEQILEDVAEIFRVKQYKLFSIDGKRVESIQELFLGPSIFVLAGKESFIAMEYRRNRSDNGHMKSGSSASNSAAVDSSVMPKELKKTKGRWRITVTTSELPAAGTDSRISLTVYGVKGNSGSIPLAAGNTSGNSTVANKDKEKKLFMSGNEDEFVVNVGFISEIRKIRISHDNSGKTSPGWLCEEVILSDLTTGEVLTFPFNRWLSRDEDDGEICRELPAVVNNEPVLPVLRYIVTVKTGNLWNGGTEANVYITLYGMYGDSGARLLQQGGKAKSLYKGSSEVFRFEAVSLGTLQRIVVGHDGIGPGAGWYLDKIIVKEDRVGSDEFIFNCDRWLDEGDGDGKIVRELYAEQKMPANSRLRITAERAKEMRLWEKEKWKFQKGNQIMFISTLTGKALRTKPDGVVDGLGDVGHPFGVYEVISRRGSVRVFTSKATPSFHLAIDQNRLLGQGKGGTFCEFMVKVQPDRSIMLESCRYVGQHIMVDGNGKPVDCRSPSTSGRSFNVYVKGCFRHNSVVLLNTSASQALVVTAGGDVVGTGKRVDVSGVTETNAKSPKTGLIQFAYFRVIKVAEGVRMFQCEKNPRRYLRIKDGQCDGLGTGDVYCNFKVQRYKHGAYVTLQSMKHRGVFIGLSTNGKARPTVDTGDINTQFFPEVIKFGEPKKEPAKSWKTPEPSFVFSSDVQNRLTEQKKSPQEQSPTKAKTSNKDAVKLIQIREDSSAGPQDGDYRIYVTTGNSGMKEAVTLSAYGDKGMSRNITLGKGSEGGIFQCGQTDELQANLSSIGRLHKIRIGVEEASANCDWRLKQVKMKDMTTNEIFRFKFNRWISRNKDDGDTLRELPVVIEGTDGSTSMLRYYIQVRTSKGSTSLVNKKSPAIYMDVFGEKGDTGRRLLQKRSCMKNGGTVKSSKKLFEPGQVDVFEIEAVSLGVLTKCSLSCPTSLQNSSKVSSASYFPSWLCEEIVIRESEGATTEYVFDCKKWLGLKKAGSHAHFALTLSTIREVKTTSSAEADFKEGDWKVSVKTGSQENAGTTANVVFYAYGEDGSVVGPVLFGNGSEGLFTPGHAHKFKVDLSEISDLYKIRIGQDNTGADPSWYVDNIELSDLHNDIKHTLPVKKWLAADKENYQLFAEIPIAKPGVEPPSVLKYQIMVYTGSILGSDTDANVSICVHGAKGDSGMRPLIKSKNNAIKFQESQMDLFELEAVDLGELTKIKIGHDGVGHGNGWFLHKVIIKTSGSSDKDYIFFSNRWLDDGQDDGKIVREIMVEPHENGEQVKLSDGEYRVLVTTGMQSTTEPCPPDARVSMVVYGEEGKTGEIVLQPSTVGRHSKLKRNRSSQSRARDSVSLMDCFKPNKTDEFKVELPEIGKIYKLRMSYNPESNWSSWYLEQVILEEVATKQQLVFPCNRWLSPTDDDQECVREIALVNDKDEMVKTYSYQVSIHTGDRHGAETDANVFVLLRGERGDSGRRYMKNALTTPIPFQRSSVDMFNIEAVDLGRVVEVVVGHDGEGYGSGWFVDKVTVRAGEFASTEWVFHCHSWLDDHIGDCKTSRRLPSIGAIMLEGQQEEELRDLGTPSSRETGNEALWDVTVLFTDIVTKGLKRVHLTGTFYAFNGKKKSDVVSLGEWSMGGRKQLKLQTNLGDIGEIYKLRVEIPDYKEKVVLNLASITMQNTHNKEIFQFAFHCQLRTESGSTVRELPALRLNRDFPKLTRYLVDVTVAKHEIAPEGLLSLKLVGESGDSGFRTLITGAKAYHATEQTEGYIFSLTAVELGRLTHVVLAYESEGKDKSDGWMIHGVTISIDDPPSSSAISLSDPVIYKADVEQNFKTLPSIDRIEKEYSLTEELPNDVQLHSKTHRQDPITGVSSKSRGLWNLTLLYSENDDIKEDISTDDDYFLIRDLDRYQVMVQVFGTRNASEPFLLSKLNPKRLSKKKIRGDQNVKVIETQIDLGSDMGVIYLLRFSCKQWNPDLIKVKLKDVNTNQEFLSHITDAQHQKFKKVPSNGHRAHLDIQLVRPDVPPLEHHKYQVTLRTGDLPAAGTDANIWINLFGTHGDTGQRRIKPVTWDAFTRGKTDTFSIETFDVGEPRRILVKHDGSGSGAGWFLEEVAIQEERNDKQSDFVFQCNRWLDDSVDEKVTQKDLYLTGIKLHYPMNYLKESKGHWKCRLKTRMLPEDDIDTPLVARVSFFLHDHEQPLTALCKVIGSEKEFEISFPQSSAETTVVNDGDFYKIRVEVVSDKDKRATNEWPFEELLMANLDSREKLHFVFDDAAIWEGNNRNVVRELPVMRTKQRPLKLYDYYVMVFTSHESTPHSNQSMKVQVQLDGKNGKSGWRELSNTKNKSNALLQPGKMEMLFIEAVDLGDTVDSVSIKIVDSKVRLKLDKIKVKKGFFSGDEFVFDFGRWIEGTATNPGGAHIETLSLAKTVLSPSPPKSRGHNDSNVAEAYDVQTVLDVDLFKDKEDSDELPLKEKYLPNIAVKLYGNLNTSGIDLIEKLAISRGEKRANIQIKPSETLSTLQKVGIGIESFDASSRAVQSKLKSLKLLKVMIRNTKTQEYFSFSPGVTIFDNTSAATTDDDSSESGTNWIELIPETPKQVSKSPELIDYTISIRTGAQEEAGTTANVYLILYGDRRYEIDGGKRWLLSHSKKDKFLRGMESQFTVRGVDLGDLKKVTIGHDGNDATMGWFLEQLTVKPSNSMKKYVFVCEKWLANLHDDTFIERTLEVHHTSSSETYPKRPVSMNGISPDPDSDHAGSHIQSNETLHGRPSTQKSDAENGDHV